jgi:hypothetical protein
LLSQEGQKWTTFTPPAPPTWRRYRGLILHRRSQPIYTRYAIASDGAEETLQVATLDVTGPAHAHIEALKHLLARTLPAAVAA